MDVAPYIYDAWQPQHVLLTGRTGDTGAHDFIDTLALGWGGYIAWQQYRHKGD